MFGEGITLDAIKSSPEAYGMLLKDLLSQKKKVNITKDERLKINSIQRTSNRVYNTQARFNVDKIHIHTRNTILKTLSYGIGPFDEVLQTLIILSQRFSEVVTRSNLMSARCYNKLDSKTRIERLQKFL